MARLKPPTRSALEYVPDTKDLDDLQAAAKVCHGCNLYLHATQTVFGEGHAHSEVLFVGEQPGDQEDRSGKPFVDQRAAYSMSAWWRQE